MKAGPFREHGVPSSTRSVPRNVIVVGMARSGTSLTAHIFARQGYSVGWIEQSRHREGDDHNPFGYFEADDLVAANVGVLRRAGYSEHNTWRFAPISAESVRRIGELAPSEEDRRFVAAYERSAPWMWKDPRLCFTLAYWWKLMDARRTGVLLVRRDPDEIYWSFRRRGWSGATDSDRRALVQRVAQHLEAARDAMQSLDIPHLAVDYADFLGRPDEMAERIGHFCGLELSAQDLNVQPDLNHSQPENRLAARGRMLLQRIPPGPRKWLRRHAPRTLLRLAFPEWRYIERRDPER